MREIVTLQLGHVSNFVGSHFWNAQESYFTYSQDEESLVDHDVHWRPGLASDGSDTFLPRTVIYDLKGGFGALRKINALYDTVEDTNDATSSSLWHGPTTLRKQETTPQSAYQRALDTGSQPSKPTKSSVRYWSDFSHTYFHPKSLSQLYDFELHSSIRPFDKHATGCELFDTLDKEDDLVDRDLRPFVEECDRMQGMQLFATLDDAWGGFGSRYLATLRDEYPKSCLWLWGLTNPMYHLPRERRQLGIVNTAQSIASAHELASMTVPLSLPETIPRANVDLTSNWHVSGVLATAIESALLQTRLAAKTEYGTSLLWDAVNGLNTNGSQTLARLTMAVNDVTHGQTTSRSREQSRDDIDFFGLGHVKGPSAEIKNRHTFGQLLSFRGSGLGEKSNNAIEAAGPERRRLPGHSVVQTFESPLNFPLLDTFPAIYPDSQGATGLRIETTLSTDTSQMPRLKALRTQSSRLIPLDERESLSNSLADLAESYRNDWESGSDADDDDL